MKINEILDVSKNEKLIHYLETRGFFRISDLSKNVIEQINFIPGLDMKTLINAKNSLLLELKKHKENIKLENTHEEQLIKNGHEPLLENQRVVQDHKTNNNQNQTKGYLGRIKIVDFVYDIPRAHFFASYCHKFNIFYIDQVSESMLLNIDSIKSIGKKTANQIRERFNDGIDYNKFGNNMNMNEENNLDFIPSIQQLLDGVYKADMFITFCHSKGLYTINDLVKLDITNLKIKGVSNRTKNNIIKRLLSYLEDYKGDFEKPNVHSMVKNLPINLFFKEEVIKNMKLSHETKVQDFVENLDLYTYVSLSSTINELKNSYVDNFEEELINLDTREYDCLIKRARGLTLQIIADDYDLTRERVRQLLHNVSKRLYPIINIIMRYISKNNKTAVKYNDLKKIPFTNEFSLKIMLHIINTYLESDYIILNFTDLIVPKKWLPENYSSLLKNVFDHIVGNGVSLDYLIEQSANELIQIGFDFLEVEDIENYLLHNGYLVFANFVMRKSSSYAFACINAISEHYNYDIKLDNNELNKDMFKLREIMKKEYPGIKIGSSNRSLSSRLMDYMILSGRGRYLPVSKVFYDKETIEEIVQYINQAEQNTFYFSELFQLFKQKLITKSRIDNKYLLQGVLKHIYSDEFSFDRDSISKTRIKKQSFDSRVIKLLLDKGVALSRLEIRKSIPGLEETVLTFIIARNKDLINYGDSRVNHIQNMNLSKEFIDDAFIIIKNECEKTGYLSIHELYGYLQNKHSFTMEENLIINSTNLYYVLQVYFSKDYVMELSPHILKQGIVSKVSSYEIVKYYVMKDFLLHKHEIDNFSLKNKWPSVTVHTVMKSIDEEFLRISENEYVLKDSLKIDNTLISEIDETISLVIKEYEFLPITSVVDFSLFPKFKYSWNGFLLESFIIHYSRNYKIIKPKINDRRYLKSLILNKYSTPMTFEEVIAGSLIKEKYTKISEYDFLNHLNSEGIGVDQIPSEFYNGEKIFKKGEYFYINIK